MPKPRALVFWLAFLAVALIPRASRANNDPHRGWYSIETPHFRVTYHSGIEPAAQHVASIAEQIYGTMTTHLGWEPREKTEILLTDNAESANGSAGALPYNSLHLLVTAPEDMSPLGDVDDWSFELVTHEYTHILHTDQIRGIPAIVNAVVGKTLAPNQTQPRWILEGLAVYEESARTSGGRLRNSMWDMFMRADVLEDNIASIDQVSNTVRRWPQGNLYYEYGSFFTRWIAETHGEEAFRRAAADYGRQLIPWGFNRSIKRATGETYVEMYPKWIAWMKQHYGDQAAEVRKKGIRGGTRITTHGQLARYPRWIPKNAWKEHQGELLYYRDDSHDRPGLYAIDLAGKKTELVARTGTECVSSFFPDGGLLFDSTQYKWNVYVYGDLERMAPGRTSPYGFQDGGRTRITPTERAADPDVSPDGRRIVFTLNGGGTRTVHVADITDQGIGEARPLVAPVFSEQAFTPRWSPDGRYVAYSAFKLGGKRDIRVVDMQGGTWHDLMDDRAVDGNPSWSHDGKYIYFHSDRTGITNIYAYEIATKRILQVTNVVNGAYQPEPSPDGKTLAYIGYTKDGFDLYTMPIDESSFTEAEPYVDDRPPVPVIVEKKWDTHKYNPIPSLWPRKYSVTIGEGAFGRAVTMGVSAGDIAALHVIEASTTTEIEKPEFQGGIVYTYYGLPVDAAVSLTRNITPRGDYKIGAYQPTVVQETTSFASSLSFTRQISSDTNSFVLSHVVTRVGAELPFPIDKLDPYETPNLPPRGLASSLHLGWSYSNVERYLWSIGAERGFSASLGFDWTDPALGSDFAGFVVDGSFTSYYVMPWLRHHSVAVHAGGGTSSGTFPGRGAFFVGSFVELPVVDVLRKQLIQGGITLRGYPSVIEAGRSYLQGNVEYRFPIVNVDRGLSTLPLFLNRITGNLFFDYGSAFDLFSDAKFKSGTGAEVWFESTLGYIVNFNWRLGYAKGLASGGLDKLYFVAAVPY